MPVSSTVTNEAGHLDSRAESPSTDVEDKVCWFSDIIDARRVTGGWCCFSEGERIVGGAGNGCCARPACDSQWGPACSHTDRQVDSTQSASRKRHGGSTMEDGQPPCHPTLGTEEILSSSPRDDAGGRHSKKPVSVLGAPLPPCVDEGQLSPADGGSGHSALCPGVGQAVTSSACGPYPVECDRAGDGVSVTRTLRPLGPSAQSPCWPAQDVPFVGRMEQSVEDPLTSLPAAQHHSSQLLAAGCPSVAARSEDGWANNGLHSPLRSTSDPRNMSALKNAARPQLKLVVISALDCGSDPTTNASPKHWSSSVSTVSSPTLRLSVANSRCCISPSAESQCSCLLASVHADPSPQGRSSLSVHPPVRTHSSSSVESVDSGVWSPGPLPSPTDGAFMASSVSQPQSMPQPPASRQPLDSCPAFLLPHVSQTSRPTCADSSRSASSVFPVFQLCTSTSTADTGPTTSSMAVHVGPTTSSMAVHVGPTTSSMAVQVPHELPGTRHSVDSRVPSQLPPLAQLSTQPANNGSASSQLAAPLPQQHSGTAQQADSDPKCLTDFDRLQRSTRALEDACFYYPELDSDGARALLQASPLGTFLVRGSSDPRFLFAVSLKTERGPTSIRIHYEKGLFQMDCVNPTKNAFPRFETMLDLLDFHATLCRQPQGSHYRWLEASRRRDLHVRLSAPLRHSPPSLVHQARVTVNRSLEDLHLPARSTDLLPVPAAIKRFLRAYPYRI